MLSSLATRIAARGAARTIVGIGTTAVVLAGMFIAESHAAPSPEVRATKSAGALSISDSRADRAVLTGRNMLPGDVVSGTVTISNSGEKAGLFQLAATGLTDTPGPGGGLLSDDLRLRVDDVTNPARPVVLYDGTLGGLGVVPVGELRSGADDTFRFTVTRPRGGPQKMYQLATTEVDFDWTAIPELTGKCANQILGSERDDVLSGSGNGDTIMGGPGNDLITGLGGQDCLYGESGNDIIDARDGEADQVDCGPGIDTVLTDSLDTTTGCEHVLLDPSPAAAAAALAGAGQ